MKPYVVKLFRRVAAANLSSSNFSIGTASAFVLATAALSLVADRPAPSDPFGGGWMLRGALAPAGPAPERAKSANSARLSSEGDEFT